jgi:hypothetical protein
MSIISVRSLGVLLSVFIMFNCYSSLADEKVRICYISSSIGHILPRANDLNQEWKGFQFAVEKHPKLEFLVQQTTSKSGVLEGVSWAKSQNCMVVVGIVTSQDAIIAAPMLKKNDLFAVSSTATTIKVKHWASHFRSFSVSTESYVEDLRKKVGEKKVLVIGEPGSIFSQGFKELVQKNFISTNYAEVLNPDARSKIREADLVFFANYPIEAMPWLQLSELKEKKIFGNQSWNEIQVFNQIPRSHFLWSNIQILSPFNIKEAQKSSYAKKYFKKFKNWPDHDSYYDYEVVEFIASCVIPKAPAVRSEIYRCLRNKRTYRGATGSYMFSPEEAHPKRPQSFYFLSEMPERKK